MLQTENQQKLEEIYKYIQEQGFELVPVVEGEFRDRTVSISEKFIPKERRAEIEYYYNSI